MIVSHLFLIIKDRCRYLCDLIIKCSFCFLNPVIKSNLLIFKGFVQIFEFILGVFVHLQKHMLKFKELFINLSFLFPVIQVSALHVFNHNFESLSHAKRYIVPCIRCNLLQRVILQIVFDHICV